MCEVSLAGSGSADAPTGEGARYFDRDTNIAGCEPCPEYWNGFDPRPRHPHRTRILWFYGDPKRCQSVTREYLMQSQRSAREAADWAQVAGPHEWWRE